MNTCLSVSIDVLYTQGLMQRRRHIAWVLHVTGHNFSPCFLSTGSQMCAITRGGPKEGGLQRRKNLQLHTLTLAKYCPLRRHALSLLSHCPVRSCHWKMGEHSAVERWSLPTVYTLGGGLWNCSRM